MTPEAKRAFRRRIALNQLMISHGSWRCRLAQAVSRFPSHIHHHPQPSNKKETTV